MEEQGEGLRGLKTPMFIAIDGELVGIIAVSDVVKDTRCNAIKKLHEMGIEVAIITEIIKELLSNRPKKWASILYLLSVLLG